MSARKTMLALLLVLPAAAAYAADAANPDPYAAETAEQRDARMKWWRQARFGMFIHWGVYAVPAGVHQGKRVEGIGEWIMNRAKIPVAEYRAYARQFNPVRYDPDAWVALARQAGMKYIVITSKHHDGFALFDSGVTDWDVVDATPWGRDLLKPLAEACRRQGMKLGFYYSQAQDWTHPGGAAWGGHWDKAQDGDMDAYIRDIAVPQVREILTRYGPLAVLWWDTPRDMTRPRAEMLIGLLRLQPGIIHNNRLGGGFPGDTETPEQFVPPTGYPGGRDWETCMTMNDTWGYKSWDDNWKSTTTLIRNLADIASKGGNYLLNVGPTAEGLIPQPSVDRLTEIGRWMAVNGRAIHATVASPFRRLPWGRCTRKVAPDGDVTLYLHVFDWPADGRLEVPGLKSPVHKAFLLADDAKRPLEVSSGQDGPVIRVPPAAPDPVCSVVVCKIEGRLEVEESPLVPGPDGRLILPAAEANLVGGTFRLEMHHGGSHVGHWTDPGDQLNWLIRPARAGACEATLEVAAPEAGVCELAVGDRILRIAVDATGGYGEFRALPAGRIELPAGRCTLTLRPVRDGWKPFNLRSVTLAPVP